MSNDEFSHWYKQLNQNAVHNHWRNLVVLIGENHWLKQQISSILCLTDTVLTTANSAAVCGLCFQDEKSIQVNELLLSVNCKNYHQYLGTEQQLVVLPLARGDDNNGIESDFDLDAFAALSGTIVAGGVLVLTITINSDKEKVELPQLDNFLQRFWQLLKCGNSHIIKQNAPLVITSNDKKLQAPKHLLPANRSLSYDCKTQEQVLAVDAILKVVHGHRDRPLVLTADRGRGKSSAMAIAACQLLVNSRQNIDIVITATSRQALNVFFQQVKRQLPEVEVNSNRIEHENGVIIFLPIDKILLQQPSANVVMVDEAAAFPVYLLRQLLESYHRLVFSSTVHGYEGAGRGFSIKFRQVLNSLRPQWRKFHIHEPIRWASNDPLESFVFSSCLLNAELPKYPNEVVKKVLLTSVTVQQVEVSQLLADEALLQQVFCVLVTAHYQTSPSDVKLLLNNPAISLFTLTHKGDVLGVAMMLKEGQVDAELAEHVRTGKRRLRDQFLPQSLLTHCGFDDSFNYHYQRVMRIAIHPQFQDQGLGGYFLGQIEQQLQSDDIDFIGSSFAGNAGLLSFWQQSGYSLARIGFTKDKASGEHSCLLVKPLTKQALEKQKQITESFYQQFDYWLTDEFKHLPAQMVWQVLHHNLSNNTKRFNDEHKRMVEDFISAKRQFSSCVFGIHHWLIAHCLHDFNAELLPIITRVLQKHSVEQVCQQYGFTGKKAFNQYLVATIKKYYQELHFTR